MSQTICCVPGCTSKLKNGDRLHCFPHPEKNADQFRTWVMRIGGELLAQDNTFIFKNRRVCSKHFETVHIYSKRLCQLAIPLHNLPGLPDHKCLPSSMPDFQLSSRQCKQNVTIETKDPEISSCNQLPMTKQTTPSKSIIASHDDQSIKSQNHLTTKMPNIKKKGMATTSTSIQRDKEWLTNKLGTLWTTPQFCGLCLETTGNFYPLKTEFVINEHSHNLQLLKDIISSVLFCDIEDHVSSDLICEQCTHKSIQAYVFIENTKKSFKTLRDCVNDLMSKVTDLNNELDENKNYENSNVIIVIEYDSETMGDADKNMSPPESYKNKNREILKRTEEINSEMERKNNFLNKENASVPTPRIIKYPRIKEIVKEDKPIIKADTPTFSLEGGKLVIAPLTTSNPSTPRYNTYTCNSCPSIFTTYRSLKEHEKSFHNTTIYQCRFCTKKYNSQQYLDVHYVNNHSKSRCRHCHGLIDTKDINDHLRSEHKNQVSICEYCDLVYYTQDQLETHFKSVHLVTDIETNNNKTQCALCLKNCSDKEIKTHKCKFSCLECLSSPCVHYSYLMSYREQILSHATKIRCIDCDFTTKRKEQLIAHVNREHLDHHPFTCNDCGTQFYTKLSLKTHIVQFHQDLKCQYCDHEFKNNNLLQKHRELCKCIMRPYPCELCVASFDTDSELKKHTNLSHSEIVFPCTLCKKEFPNEFSLKEHHIKIHSGIQYKKRRKFIECTLCDITFNNLKEMVQHEEIHEPNELYPCKVCTKSFSSLRKMYIHKQKHYSQRTKCNNCKKYVVTEHFKLHISVCTRFSSESSPFTCQICDKGFNVESALQNHKKLHAKPSPCTYCYKLIKPASMKKHIELNHSTNSKVEKSIYKCCYCNYTTKKQFECENHINKIHLKIKPYVCQTCNKAFCGKARLEEHVKIHSNKSSCFCSFCGKKFANKVCLKMHTRRHTGEKPYECNICQEKFRSCSIMKTHRLKKHQDKTIQCPLCDSMYHLVAEMRFHVKKVHWKRPEPFDFKQIVSEEHYHLFEDRRLQKLGQIS